MTTAVQHRRGTTAEHATFTGLEGEVTIDTTKDTAVIHDGVLAGGYPLAKESLANVNPSTLGAITGSATASDDLFLVFDTSTLTMKKITRAELNNAIEADALASVTITGGTINGTTIGGTTPAAGSFTNLTATGTVTIPDNAISGDKVEGGTINAITINTLSGNVNVTGTVTADGLTVDGLVKSDTASNGFRVLKGSGAYYGELSVDYISNDVFTYVDSIAGASYNGIVKIRTANNGGSVADRVKISSSGVSFYEDTGTTPKLFWDASAESLGIGTSSPATKLNIENAGACQIQIAYNSTNYGRIGRKSDGSYEFASYENGASLTFGTTNSSGSTTTNMTLDRYGNLGLGVTPSAWTNGWRGFQVNRGAISWSGTGPNEAVQFSGNAFFTGSGSDSNTATYIAADFATNYRQRIGQHQWYTAPSGTAGNAISFTQAMTLTSNGTFLVGKTSTSAGVAGFMVEPEGDTYITAQGVEGRVLYLNRLSSDGDIIQLAKDGTTVGSIGAGSAGDLIIGKADTQDCFLRFGTGGSAITLCDSDGLNTNDGAVDLGVSNYRFKDLYLSGGVYVGGTAAANKLDDYEEGSWNPTVSPSTSGSITLNASFDTMSYTKIGRLVHLQGRVDVSSVSSPVGNLVISNLPFVVQNLAEYSGQSVQFAFVTLSASATGLAQAAEVIEGGTSMVLRPLDWGTTAQEIISGSRIQLSITYATS